MTVAWFGCSTAGVAGDMLLGSLLDCGADIGEVRAIVGALGVGGWSLEMEQVERGGIAATRAVVDAPEVHVHRTWRTIRALLAEATLPDRVRARAHATFAALADVEGALHRIAPDDVALHEVGALDAIVDVVGSCAALEVLGVDDVAASPIATGHGTTSAAHGRLPVPAPATARLLVGLPVAAADVATELATPTGVAFLRTLATTWGPPPAMTVTATGFGAGTKELDDRPNVVQAIIGVTAQIDAEVETLTQLETNVDDVTGEVLAHTIARLLDAGAVDAWATPIVMKKGRPAHTVAALAHPADLSAVRQVLLDETGSLGVRVVPVQRHAVTRTETTVDVDGHPVRIKIAGGRAKPEFDDAAAAAAALGRPVRSILAAAEAAYRREHS